MLAAPRPLALRLTAALLVLATVLVYANTLNAPFVFDDAPAIIENPSIRDLRDLGAVLSPPSTAGSAAGRPLINLSFALNYALGDLNPRSYHLVNLAFHAATALALFGVIRRTLLQPALRDRFAASALPLAGAIALLWAVHPLLTESVTCAVQRTEVFGGLFYLLILYSFIRATAPGITPHRWLALSIAACFLGVATKEIVATAPLAVLAYDCLFVAGSLRAALRQRWRLYTAFAASWLLLAWLMSTSAQRGGVVGFGHGVSSWEYLLTQCRALTLYLKLSVWPDPLVLDYGLAVVRQLSAVWPQALLLVTLALATGWGLWKKHPAAFAGAWFFLILAPSSSVVPLVSQPIAEHRMYLPLAAVIALIALTVHRLLGRPSLWLFVALAAVLSVVTVRRNAVYHSTISILSDTVAQQPDNARAHSLLGLAYEKSNRLADAVASAREAARLDPGSAQMHYNLGRALLQTAQPADAATAFTAALQLRPDYAEAHGNLSVALLALDRPAEAFTHLEAALRAKPDYADAHFNLGNLLARQRRLADAVTHYEAALRLEPDRADAHFNLGKALLLSRRPAEAVLHFEAVLRLTPNDPDAARSLAIAREFAARP